MPKNKSLVRQVQDVLDGKLRIGESKHAAKQLGTTADGIFSWSTYKVYLTKGCAFVKWARENHDCRTLADARKYVDAYIKHHIDEGYSASTQKTIASALAKIYSCSTKDFIPTETRYRANITRSRMGKAKFSEARNREFVNFCKATGLRKHEFLNLKPENLRYDDANGQYMLVDLKGKGGRLRECPILSTEAAERIKNTPEGQKVWPKIPANPDIHSYRADYCQTLYESHGPPAEIPKGEKYYCRKDLKGVVYDKRAMRVASRALGHNRINVIASSYLGARAANILQR